MSTRCNIYIEGRGEPFILYHHSDGYPEGVGVHLVEQVKSGCWFCPADFANHLIKLQEKYVNYELTDQVHGDIEYLYCVDTQKRTVTCYKRPWTNDNPTLQNITIFNNIREIPEPKKEN